MTRVIAIEDESAERQLAVEFSPGIPLAVSLLDFERAPEG
jgi:hypothetical protein